MVLPLTTLLLLEELLEATAVMGEGIVATTATAVSCHGIVGVFTLIKASLELWVELVIIRSIQKTDRHSTAPRRPR